MVLRHILIIYLLGLSICLFGQRNSGLRPAAKLMFTEVADGKYELRKPFAKLQDNTRLTAIALDLTLGILGAHRMYLGTDVKIIAAYALTCGGGCILWLVDLGLLIFSDDISPYYNNPHLFMWTAEGNPPK